MLPVLRILLPQEYPILCLPRTLFSLITFLFFSSSIECDSVCVLCTRSTFTWNKKGGTRHVNNNIIQSSPRSWLHPHPFRVPIPIPRPIPFHVFVFVCLAEFPSGYFERVMYAFHVFFSFFFFCMPLFSTEFRSASFFFPVFLSCRANRDRLGESTAGLWRRLGTDKLTTT